MDQSLDRRAFLRMGAGSAAAGAAALATGAPAHADQPIQRGWRPHRDLEGATIAELQERMAAGDITARQLTVQYLNRIRRLDTGPDGLLAVLETNPDAIAIAQELDVERRRGRLRGPLHGIPIIVKDNIDTDDSMHTTAGSLALVGSHPGADSTMAARLRDAGAIILGKANLSEWANFRGFQSSSGWSARGDQVRNPHMLDRNPCGSSSGSGAAAAASLCAGTLGTETDGSIVCPSSANGVVGIKPTVGLTSRAGVVPISRTQDTIGPICRTVADAAALLGPLTGVDPRDPATADSAGNSFDDYRQFLDPDGLNGARIGVARQLFFGSRETNRIMESVVGRLGDAGATVVDPVEFPSFEEFSNNSPEFDVLLFEFKTDVADYLATRVGGPKTLAELIAFNEANAALELQWFGQEIFEIAEGTGGIGDPAYPEALARLRQISRADGLDAVLDGNDLDAIIAPTGSPAWPTDLVNGDHFIGGSSSYAAMAGYPLVTVPMGAASALPVGLTFMGRQWAEPTLIRLASGFEAHFGPGPAPQYLPTLPT